MSLEFDTNTFLAEDPGGMEEHANQACSNCKKSKRRCDKALPACGLCARLHRPCDYDAPESHLTQETFSALVDKVASLEAALSLAPRSQSNDSSNGTHTPSFSHGGLSEPSLSDYSDSSMPQLISFRLPPPTFPSIYFLDSSLFQAEHYSIQKPHVKVPQEILLALGSSDNLRDVIDGFFRDTHKWLPIVSRTRLLNILQGGSFELGADTALLLIAMKVIQADPNESSGLHGHLFQLTKSFIWYTESQGAYSLQLLQAAVILAAFELGNAIYPAAFLTIGFCARLAVAMGIHDKDSPQILPKPVLWTEQEERRRVWWAIVVLDRVVSIGKRGHPLATSVSVDALLPVDDTAWTAGETSAAQPLSVTANTQVKPAPFARLCQASHLLGRVIEHANDNKMTDDFRYQEAFSLNQAVSSFSCAASGGVLDHEAYGIGYCPSLTITISALFQLYERYACPDSVPSGASEGYIAMQEVSIKGLSIATDKIYDFAGRLLAHVEVFGLDGISPLMLDAFYQCAANYTWYAREQGDEVKRGKCEDLRRLLRILDQRWKAAGEYLRIVENFEAMGMNRLGH